MKGLFSVIVTPINSDNGVDIDVLRQLIRFQIAAGADGIVVLGTTGEAPTLTHSEKENVIKVAREETLHKVHFMVGTGSYSTAQTIENTRQAEVLGADSVLIVTPYYNRPTQEGIYLHFKAVAEAVDIPIMVYNIQGRTGQNILTDTLIRLASHKNICGVKEASGNLIQIMEVIERIGRHNPSFSIMSGDDALTLPCMSMGGHGILSVLSNLVPLQIKALVKAAQANENETALALHYQLMPLVRLAFMETNPIPIKAAMRFSGMAVGHCRLPLCDLLPENEKKLLQGLADPSLAHLIAINKALYASTAKAALAPC